MSSNFAVVSQTEWLIVQSCRTTGEVQLLVAVIYTFGSISVRVKADRRDRLDWSGNRCKTLEFNWRACCVCVCMYVLPLQCVIR